MARGGPDWGVGGATETIATVDDMGELAARLGSIVTYDRRGNVVWLDDFEAPVLHWNVGLNGAGAAGALSTATARNGAQSVALTAGSDTNRFAFIGKYFPYPALCQMGVEFSFQRHAYSEYIQLSMELYTGSKLYRPRIRVNLVDKQLEYWSTGLGWVPFATGIDLGVAPPGYTIDHLFYTLKVVIDFPNKKYKAVLLQDKSYDLSVVDFWVTDDPTGPVMDITIYHYGAVGSNPVAYIDDVIITQNEP